MAMGSQKPRRGTAFKRAVGYQQSQSSQSTASASQPLREEDTTSDDEEDELNSDADVSQALKKRAIPTRAAADPVRPSASPRPLPSTRRSVSPEAPRVILLPPQKTPPEIEDEELESEDELTPGPLLRQAKRTRFEPTPPSRKKDSSRQIARKTVHSPANPTRAITPESEEDEEAVGRRQSQSSQLSQAQIKLVDADDQTSRFKIRVGMPVYVIYTDDGLNADPVDVNDLGVGVVIAIKSHGDMFRVKWLYRPLDMGTLPSRVKQIHKKAVGQNLGLAELTESEHHDDIFKESVVEPPAVYRFQDNAKRPKDAVNPIYPPGDDLEISHICSDAAWFMRSAFGEWNSAASVMEKALRLNKHCICGKPYNPYAEMRRCRACAKWYHRACLKREAKDAPGDDLVIRGAQFGMVGNFGLVENAESWRSWDHAPKVFKDAIKKAQNQKGRICPDCKSTV